MKHNAVMNEYKLWCINTFEPQGNISCREIDLPHMQAFKLSKE